MKKPFSRIPLGAAALALLGVMGCDAGSDRRDEPASSAPKASLGSTQQAVVLGDPNDVYFAEVLANGTGCPAGTWNTAIAEDGKVFTTTFSAYEAVLEENQAYAVADCQLAIKLHSPQGMSYSVQSFYYSGYSFLEEGVSGKQTARYYFQGNPVDSGNAHTDLVGPYDDGYLFQDDVEIADTVVWSPCGTQRDLNILTRLRLTNSRPRRSGYMNLSAVDGSAKLVLKLAWKSCPLPDGGTSSIPGNQGTILDGGLPGADGGVRTNNPQPSDGPGPQLGMF